MKNRSAYVQCVICVVVGIVFGVLFKDTWDALYVTKSQSPSTAQTQTANFEKWLPPQAQWDGSWTQTRFETNTGLAEMRELLPSWSVRR